LRLSDVFLPAADDPSPRDEEMEGTVIDFSDSGAQARFFAVVEVVRKQTVIVPMHELRISPGQKGG
jgi:hypothetical protein